MPHIEVRNVSLVYDTPAGRVPAIVDVNVDIEVSEFLCIVGPSGCGKSTLLNVIAGFLVPTAGQIRIGEKPVTGHGLDRGVVFQDFAQLFPWRTALGNVTFGLEMKGMGKAEREAIALEQLRLVKPELPIRLPRPRDPLSVEFLEYQKSLLRHLGQDAGAQATQAG